MGQLSIWLCQVLSLESGDVKVSRRPINPGMRLFLRSLADPVRKVITMTDAESVS